MSRWCSGCIGPSEGLGPGSNPGRDTDCPRGVAEARDPAKVVGQVRLLAGIFFLGRSSQKARRPAATRQKWVRLPRASLSFAPKGRPRIAWGGSPRSSRHRKQRPRPEGAALESAAPSGRNAIDWGTGANPGLPAWAIFGRPFGAKAGPWRGVGRDRAQSHT